MPRKADTISYREFNKLTDHTSTNHDPLPGEVLFDDENIGKLEETLMGMEYDLEDLDELADDEEKEILLELVENDEDEDYSDLDADINVELDESVIYKGHSKSQSF